MKQVEKYPETEYQSIDFKNLIKVGRLVVIYFNYFYLIIIIAKISGY